MSERYNSIVIGADHAGFEMKGGLKTFLESEGYVLNDVGVHSDESADYPPIAQAVARAVQEAPGHIGILVCGSGIGMAIAANRFSSVRAAVCWNEETAKLSREHNDANVLVLPGRFLSTDEALSLLKIFLNAEFEGGRHSRRIELIENQQ